MNGTPLQAIKFALAFRDQGDSRDFLMDWSHGLIEYWEADNGQSYEDFCAANPDHAPDRAADDGSVRKSYYGDGEQPWDAMKRIGWAADFAAGNVLKYLRRTKGEPDDLTKARWYWSELKKLAEPDDRFARSALAHLLRELKGTELARLEDV